MPIEGVIGREHLAALEASELLRDLVDGSYVLLHLDQCKEFLQTGSAREFGALGMVMQSMRAESRAVVEGFSTLLADAILLQRVDAPGVGS